MEFNKAYNRQEFLNFLQNSFLPEDFVPQTEEVLFPAQPKYTTAVVNLGTSHSLDLVVYEIKHSSKHDARVSLSKEAFRILADEQEDRALVVFVPEDSNDNYRFSFIEITLEVAEGSSHVTRKYSNPHRYSYYLGKGIAFYTPNKFLNEKGRVTNYEDLRSRFSVEVLTKEFYQELSDWYAWAIQIIRFPNDINTEDDDAKFNHEGAIRLITRLIFVWFLKQRHLIPNEFFDEKYIAENLLDEFNPNLKTGLFGHKSLESKYYKAILQNLFFAMLNSPITPEGSNELSERHFRKRGGDYDNNKLMRYENYFKNPQLFVNLANKTVPFLNGGLFDCLDDKDNDMYYDGFSDRETVKKSLVLPDFLFFGEEAGKDIDLSEWYGDKKKKKVSARGIIDILKRYNFTVEENTPFDKEVSLDPELLGKVFENLLASFNPETQTTARKQTGSFYTPREIVQYMVDEGLVAHLKRTVGEDLEPQYRQLLQYTDEAVVLTDTQRKAIMQSLYKCKILDPACGSGAFPMGILQQMVHILSRIDVNNGMWREMMLQQAVDETSDAYRNSTNDERAEIIADIERSFDESVNRPDYARKLYLIENCIYGVDIQPIAIQISKLRFFISLVVDQNTNDDPTDNFGIRPLPNLEAKFVAANTLIGLDKKDTTLFDSEGIKNKEHELKVAKHKIFRAKTVHTKRKYKQVVNDLRLEIANMLEEAGAVGNLEAQQLASWDMFDQNASSTFFDPDWMFGIKDGFDIVIGNPPYLRIQELRNTNSKLADKLSSSYKSATGSFDLYVTFVEKAILLVKLEGVVIYIMPTKWTNSTFGKGLRNLLIESRFISSIINFGAYQVFDASTYTGIHKFQKSELLSYLELDSQVHNHVCLDNFLRSIKKEDYVTLKPNSSDAWTLTNKDVNQILEKLNKLPYRLSDVFSKIFQGIATSKDDVYFLYECKEINQNEIEGYSKYLKNRVIIEKELVKPLLKGEDVHRYEFLESNRYVIFPYKLTNEGAILYTESEIEEYFPRGYHYLKMCEKELRGREKGRLKNDDFWYRYIYPKNLTLFQQEKLVAPEISLGGNFSYDFKGQYYSTTKVYGYIKNTKCNFSYKFLLGLLNSRLFWFFIQNTGYVLRGGYYTFKTNYVNPFPIPSFEKVDKSIIKEIEQNVQKILEINKQKNNSEFTILTKNIDLAVFKIYNLDKKEIEIILAK